MLHGSRVDPSRVHENHSHDLELVIAGLRGNPLAGGDWQAAIERLRQRYHRLAAQLLRRWYIRNAYWEADEVVQCWLVDLLSGGFLRIDSTRNPVAYVRQSLRRQCIAVVRRVVRNAIHQATLDVEKLPVRGWRGETDGWRIDAREAIDRLPATQRDTFRRYLWGDVPRRGKDAEYRQFQNRIHRARQRLRASLADGPNKERNDPRFRKPREKNSGDWHKK